MLSVLLSFLLWASFRT